MTGIAAIVCAGPGRRERLERMAASLRERPHDADGHWLGGDFGMAAAALHSTTKASQSLEPLESEDGALAIVFDGYLANYEELRRDLLGRGTHFRTASDSELALRAYEIWGEDCTAHLDGEFALIVADLRHRRLFCARDHQGLRPLYYRQEGDTLLVASDIATIFAASAEKPKANTFFLSQLVAATIVTPEETAWNGVMRVPHPSQMSFENGKVTISKHYALPVEVTRLRRSAADCVAEYRHMFAEAVRRASRTDRTLAVEVSGGLDSSAVLGIAHRLCTEGSLPAPDLRAYTLAGEPGSLSDEIDFARDAAAHIGTELVETPLFRPPLDWFADQARRERDIASYPNGVQSLAMERRMAEDGARVVLGGNGGDQWLGGSRGYVEQNLAAQQWRRFWHNGRAHIAEEGMLRAGRTIARRAALGQMPDALRGALRRAWRGTGADPFDELGLLAPSHREAIADLLREKEATYPADPVARTKLKTFDSGWTRFAADLMSRQHARVGVEARSPMLSRTFIEFCASLPEDMKLRMGQDRWIHREAMRGILPETIRTRTSKAEFPACYEVDAIATTASRLPSATLVTFADPGAVSQLGARIPEASLADEYPFEMWGLFIAVRFALENRDNFG